MRCRREGLGALSRSGRPGPRRSPRSDRAPAPPQPKARDRIAVDPIVAGVVDRGSDVARRASAVPSQARFPPVPPAPCDSTTSGNLVGVVASAASTAARPPSNSGLPGGPSNCGFSSAPGSAGYRRGRDRQTSRLRPDDADPAQRHPFQQLHGAASGIRSDDTAFSHRYDHYNLYIHPATPADAAKIVHWGRECWDTMQPFVDRAVYVNAMEDAGGKSEQPVRDA
jgi:hypothetical protein